MSLKRVEKEVLSEYTDSLRLTTTKPIVWQVLNKRFGNIKGAVSDLHRDVTTRRCLTSYDRVEDIVKECVTIKTELDKADDMMDDHKMEFEKRWQQEQLRIKTEQLMFNEQVERDIFTSCFLFAKKVFSFSLHLASHF